MKTIPMIIIINNTQNNDDGNVMMTKTNKAVCLLIIHTLQMK